MPERHLTYEEKERKDERKKSRHEAKARLRMANAFEEPKVEQSTQKCVVSHAQKKY